MSKVQTQFMACVPLVSPNKFRNVKIAIVSKTAILLTIPYVKKCFSWEFAKILLPFCAQSPAEITNRKLGVSSEMGILIFIYIVAWWRNYSIAIGLPISDVRPFFVGRCGCTNNLIPFEPYSKMI
ncbi:hypothetical protein LJB97_01835 [Parabacteroides sp. OttesenSCG-928-O15]|nr:hypothetical protein [Parabacteroides sp. OttesenSCG-928-O15]